MIFFNLDILEEQALCDSNKFLTLLKFHFEKKTIPSKWDKYKPSKVSLHGHSYLLNPMDLFNDNSTDILFKVQYIKLAARRDYSLYKLYKYKALQTSFFPDLNYSAIKYNPLLTITNTEIHFKYE